MLDIWPGYNWKVRMTHNTAIRSVYPLIHKQKHTQDTTPLYINKDHANKQQHYI